MATYDLNKIKFMPETDTLINAFVWKKTPEGAGFWIERYFRGMDGIGQATWDEMKRRHAAGEMVYEWEYRTMTNTPRKWGEMTPEEKGTLLLACHEGKEIEVYDASSGWVEAYHGWFPHEAYRVRPESKRETLTLWVYPDGENGVKIGTIDLIDGKPDLNSIKVTKAGSDCPKAC